MLFWTAELPEPPTTELESGQNAARGLEGKQMPTMLSYTYDAFKAAGVSEATARAASEEIAGRIPRLTRAFYREPGLSSWSTWTRATTYMYPPARAYWSSAAATRCMRASASLPSAS